MGIRIYQIFVLASICLFNLSCEQLIGPQGEPVPILPVHFQNTISGYVYEWEDYEYRGLNFETNSVQWIMYNLDADSLYDLIISVEYNSGVEFKINSGNNPYTELYLLVTSRFIVFYEFIIQFDKLIYI